MDAKEFIRELVRICKSQDETCSKCLIFESAGCPLIIPESTDADRLIAVVEKWSKEHPIKTNGMRFLDDNREYIRTYHRWENGCKPYIEVHIEADWWDAEYKEGSNE